MSTKNAGVTRKDITSSPSLPCTIGDKTLLSLDPKEFSTNSVGFNANGKVTLMISGKPVQFQVSMNLTAVGSKEWPKGE